MTSILATPHHRADRRDTGLDVVTGAFSYSGAAITQALVADGRRVRTVTGHSDRSAGHADIEVRPLDFDDQLGLVEPLRGATTLPTGCASPIGMSTTSLRSRSRCRCPRC